MKLLQDLVKNCPWKAKQLVAWFHCNSTGAWYKMRDLQKYFSPAQFLDIYEFYRNQTGKGAEEFMEALKKEINAD